LYFAAGDYPRVVSLANEPAAKEADATVGAGGRTEITLE
jgi:hypothetical protein